MVVPNVKYMDILGGPSSVYFLDFLAKFPSLSHLTLPGCFVHHGHLPYSWILPDLTHFCYFEGDSYDREKKTFRFLISAAPMLSKITYVYEIMPFVQDYWSSIQSNILQSIELHISNRYGRMGAHERAEEEALVALFTFMREHLRPLSSVLKFPALAVLKLYGLHEIVLQSKQLRPRLVEMANSACVDLKARDIRVCVFE